MFGKRFKLCTCCRLNVYVDASCLAVAVLMGGWLATSVVPFNFPSLGEQACWLIGLGGMAGWLASLLLHDLAHLLAARRMQAPTQAITLFAFGGVPEAGGEAPNPKSEFQLAIVGPIASVLLAGAFGGLAAFGQATSWPLSLIALLSCLAGMNAVLAAFNLLPAFPLDGGRALRAALWKWKRDLPQATRTSAFNGSGLGLALSVVGLPLLLVGGLLPALACVVTGLSLHRAAWTAYHQFLGHQSMRGTAVRQYMRNIAVAVPISATVRELVDDYIDRYDCKQLPVADGGKFAGTIHLHQALRIPNDDWEKYSVRELLQPAGRHQKVSPGAGVIETLSAMLANGVKCLPVVEGENLVGVLMRRDLLDHLYSKGTATGARPATVG